MTNTTRQERIGRIREACYEVRKSARPKGWTKESVEYRKKPETPFGLADVLLAMNKVKDGEFAVDSEGNFMEYSLHWEHVTIPVENGVKCVNWNLLKTLEEQDDVVLEFLDGLLQANESECVAPIQA